MTPKEIALKIKDDILDRRGLRQAFEEIDEEIQAEIIDEWISIIFIGYRETYTTGKKDGLEAAIKACEWEYVQTADPEDISEWNQAIETAVNAIRKLKDGQ